LKTDL